MSWQKYASPLRINFFPSRILFVVVSLMHLGALALLVPASLPIWGTVASTLLIAMSLIISCSRAGWVANRFSFQAVWPNFTEAVWDEADQWQLIDEHQCIHPAVLLPSTYVSAGLVVLNLRLENNAWYCRHRAIVLLPDNIDHECFRRLRIRLRWYSSQVQDNWAVSK